MSELLTKLLPILFIILIGITTKQTKLLNDEIIVGLKNIIIKIALPVILFRSFATMTLDVSYIILFVLIFAFCGLLYGIGTLLHRLLPKVFKYAFSGGYFTGFEFGMIGVGLFSAIWGLEKLPIIMLVGFGHELFIWFLYVPMITLKSKGNISITNTVKDFIRTPTIIGILLGILFNILSLYDLFGATLIGAAVYSTIDFLAPLTAPLILLIIGYSMTFKRLDVKQALIYISARWIVVLGIGIPLLLLIHALIGGIDPLFDQAYLAFILLPAPYILPLFIDDHDESEFFSQLLVYSTITSFVGYILLLLMNV